ncbi:DNA cytosine methyltransferase [Aminiphilus sp.]|jgi:DNA (cytosine-5)-methyltransferase 1|uniref:DNA cytosine methyltransferase n=1 Tax=Aminiphilus sp. TaxID=1872488 RepID=UPI002633D32A|nr:DNA cytosine methyltransferase [Aminiphilus sp.]
MGILLKRTEHVPVFVDLFAGAGGFSLGFRLAGARPVFAVESDKAAAETYQANFPEATLFTGDIRDLRPFPSLSPDIIVGGPPCQGFSPLGKMSTRQNRQDAHILMNALCFEFHRALFEMRPHAFVMENVPPFLKSEEFRLFVEKTERLGYSIAWGTLEAEEFGVPQKRRRGVTIGVRNGWACLPQPPGEHRTVRDALGDLPLVPTGESLHVGRNPTPESIERYRTIPPGGNRFDLMRTRPDLCPRCWLDKPSGSTDVFGRLEWDKPALTIRTEFFKPEKGRYLHPEADRPITHREAARLQTFPDSFLFCGSKVEIARQIGNAVPVRMAYHVARHVLRLIGLGQKHPGNSTPPPATDTETGVRVPQNVRSA